MGDYNRKAGIRHR